MSLICSPVANLLTCDLYQNSSTLYPGPVGVIAVSCPAAVEPRLHWAQLGHKQRSALVGCGVIRVSGRLGVVVGVLLHLGWQRDSVEEPDHMGECPPAEPAVESGSGWF